MLEMRVMNDNALLSTDVYPQDEDTAKSLNFDAISEFRFLFSLLPYRTILTFVPLIQECV